MTRSQAAHAHVHTPVCSCGFFHRREKTALGMIWLSPLLATCLCFCLHRAWCVLPSGLRLSWEFNSQTGHRFFSMFSRNLCFSFYLLGNRAATIPPGIPVTHGNLRFPGIEDVGKEAFLVSRAMPAFALRAPCCCCYCCCGCSRLGAGCPATTECPRCSCLNLLTLGLTQALLLTRKSPSRVRPLHCY